MSFYDELGDKYDMMVRWKTRLEREAPFFQRLFVENRINRVLDLGCGTGHHSEMFHKWGCEVVGVDASPMMLEKAQELVGEDDDGTLSFVQSDFTDFHNHVEGEFDAIITLGNTLPHLNGDGDLDSVFQAVHQTLRPGGVFVFQNRNYDRLLQTRERFLLPTTHRQADSEQIFFRFNDFEGDSVRFNVVHFTRVGEGWIHEVFSTDLRPWKRDQISETLKQVGFHSQDFYGDFSGTPFDAETSSDLVGLARKAQTKA